MPVLDVQDLHVSFTTEDGPVEVLKGLSYTLPKGKVLAVVGESGSGKTVHALSLLRLLPPTARITQGHIWFRGKDVVNLPPAELRKLRGSRISMIFQDPMTSLNPVFTVGHQLTETILAHTKMSKLRAHAAAVRLLKKVGIADAAKRYYAYPFQFSGGMCQRVMIAMALALRPDVLIADEPTTALDVTIQAQILRLIKKLQSQTGLSAVFITHNLALVADVADDVLVLYGGLCMERAPVEDLFARPLHPYTQGLLNSLVSVHKKADVLPVIPGYPPVPGREVAGCPFAPRCPKAVKKCFEARPPLKEFGPRAVACWNVKEPL